MLTQTMLKLKVKKDIQWNEHIPPYQVYIVFL